MTRVGVLALQGAFARHLDALSRLGVDGSEVRQPRDLDDLDGLVIPGGESTTMIRLMTTFDLVDPLAKLLADGVPTFGTCAGMILLATRIVDGRPDQHALGIVDITVRRNAYGTQLDSFEADIDITGFDAPFHAVFIRAPVVEAVGFIVPRGRPARP